MIKEMLKTINDALIKGEMTFDTAYKLLKSLSAITGKTYRILNRRVVYSEYGRYYDAWANA